MSLPVSRGVRKAYGGDVQLAESFLRRVKILRGWENRQGCSLQKGDGGGCRGYILEKKGQRYY